MKTETSSPEQLLIQELADNGTDYQRELFLKCQDENNKNLERLISLLKTASDKDEAYRRKMTEDYISIHCGNYSDKEKAIARNAVHIGWELATHIPTKDPMKAPDNVNKLAEEITVDDFRKAIDYNVDDYMSRIGKAAEECYNLAMKMVTAASNKTAAGIDNKLKEAVFQALGEASMCWSEIPKGVFDSSNAERIGNELMEIITQQAGQLFIIEGIRENISSAIMSRSSRYLSVYDADDLINKIMSVVIKFTKGFADNPNDDSSPASGKWTEKQMIGFAEWIRENYLYHPNSNSYVNNEEFKKKSFSANRYPITELITIFLPSAGERETVSE